MTIQVTVPPYTGTYYFKYMTVASAYELLVEMTQSGSYQHTELFSPRQLGTASWGWNTAAGDTFSVKVYQLPMGANVWTYLLQWQEQQNLDGLPYTTLGDTDCIVDVHYPAWVFNWDDTGIPGFPDDNDYNDLVFALTPFTGGGGKKLKMNTSEGNWMDVIG